MLLQSAQENIDLQTTILSRFDLIFIVRDVKDHARDMVRKRYNICYIIYNNILYTYNVYNKNLLDVTV